MVAAHLRTVTGRCPGGRAYREHYLFVLADDSRTVSGNSGPLSGHRPGAESIESDGRTPKKARLVAQTDKGADTRSAENHCFD